MAKAILIDSLREQLQEWTNKGLRRELILPDGLDFTSNDYLGLSRHPKVKAAAHEAIDRWGAGTPAARLLRGHLSLTQEVEALAARALKSERALLFPSGWQANQALITSLVGPEDVLASDALNHASLIDGARLSKAKRLIFKHNDMDHLEAHLKSAKGARRRLIVVEDVYSMDGDFSPITEILSLAEAYDAYLYIDHAHAFGLYDRVPVHERVIARMFTGGKALGVCGAFIGAAGTVIDWLINRGRSFVFTTAPTPATIAALGAALSVLGEEPELASRAKARACQLRENLAQRKLAVLGESPIVPVILGSEARAMEVARSLSEQGFDVRAVRPPTVPAGTSRLRIVCHADHTEEQIDALSVALDHALDPRKARYSKPLRDLGERVVVCGTDTEIGKTMVSALLVRCGLLNGREMRYLKPLQTGTDSDTDTVFTLAQLQCEKVPPIVSLALPASVDQAARAEKVSVSLGAVASGVRQVLAKDLDSNWVLECAGGLRVPLNDHEDQLDLLEELALPVVLVARTSLGTLNHSLMSLELLSRRGLTVKALILVGEEHAANRETLERWVGAFPIYHVPWFEELTLEKLDNWIKSDPLGALWDRI